jgi:hypothetical protein
MITVYVRLGGMWLPYPAFTMRQAHELARPFPGAQIWRDLVQVR